MLARPAALVLAGGLAMLPAASRAALLSPNNDNAASLYATRCSSCHGSNGQGSAKAPSLIALPMALIHFMLDTGRMPASISYDNDQHQSPMFTQVQIDALASYIASFTPNADMSMPHIGPGNPDRGRLLFSENCAECHGIAGQGDSVGSDNVAPSLMHATTYVVAEAIRGGPGIMPRFGRDVLSDQDVSDIARYVNAIQTQTGGFDTNAGGFDLGFMGPVGEGAIAWIFGLGILVLFLRAIGTPN
jgi:ubiquinol-cytochrome c reductase cytochrome c subunit